MGTGIGRKHEALLGSLLSGKLPRNLGWSEVVELIGKIGEVQPHGNGEFAFVVGSQRAFFKPPHTHSLEDAEVARLRKFLREAGIGAPPDASQPCDRVVVVIDHHGAQVFQKLSGGPEVESTLKPYDPHGFHRHLIHRKEAHYEGERVPEESSYYEAVAKDLANAREIILIGHGTGKSSALDYLAEYLKKHHPETFQHVIATEVKDLSAITDQQIEALARAHF